ncbi:hypothetical protein AB0N17_03885 [Streptomyces sp. NPDC051133]|uniref:hypothetical protein n=1 Tax=Streptomyces sp. NPDC051133 TaxID=3155521 RepID=UPI00343D36E8
MLRILDARTGEPAAAAPARRGLTRIEAYASGLDPTALRVLLTADLLVRALEMAGTPVWTTLSAPCDRPELHTAATTLSIRPFEDARGLASGLGEAQAIHVVARPRANGAGADRERGGAVPGGGPVVYVAPVVWEETRAREEGAEGAEGTEGAERARPDAEPAGDARDGDDAPARDVSSAGVSAAPAREGAPSARPPLSGLLSDPAALRLALLSVPRSEAVRLDGAVLGEAARQLAHWRRAVAGWARQPSRPVPEEVRGRLRAAWEDDLDLPAVLEVLRAVERAPDLPDGARFETYAYADRLLALDLARDLGTLG